jgi:acyl-[acyl-carrier-protein]-phospholipid O-acyltransferase/long-chain-fatty-acid--[acyl-carrier-protein] ligase
MNEFKRGFEMIARKSNCPVLPAAMDGLWGSIFSFERNKFIYKWPYSIPFGVTVNFGDPLTGGEVKAMTVRRNVEALRADAFALRQVLAKPMRILQRTVRLVGDDVAAYRQRTGELTALAVEQQTQLVANALQVGEINAIGRGQTVMLEWDALEDCRDVLAIVFAQYYKLKVVLVNSMTPVDEVRRLSEKHGVDHYFSGSTLCDTWKKQDLAGGCYDFSHDAVERDGCFPCLVAGGRLIAMSMPHPEAETATNQHQAGHCAGTWGRLLPGFHVETKDSGIHLAGASIETEGISILNVHLDQDGMLCSGEEETRES